MSPQRTFEDANTIRGSVKEAIGKLIGDGKVAGNDGLVVEGEAQELEAQEGKAQEGEGEAQRTGEVMDGVSSLVDPATGKR